MFAGLAAIDHVLVGWGWSLWDFNWYRRPDPAGLAERLAQQFSLELVRVDIESDPDLQRRYGEKIPVLVLGDEELGWGRLSQRAIEKKLRERGSGA